jgi:crotonobetainyl-CoA:carnitine CoA-transferase CaiB-like acyl-CoA transferase
MITQAYSGAMFSQGGGPSHPPVAAEWALADEVGAMNFAFAITAALVARDRANGVGQHLETSQLGAMLSFQAGGWNNIARVVHDGQMRDDGMPAYNRTPMQTSYQCGDGNWLVINPANWGQWESVCHTLGRDDLLRDVRSITMFTPPPKREKNKGWLKTQLKEHFLAASESRDELIHNLREAGVFCGPVLSYAELIEEDHVWENGYLVEVEHPRLGRKATIGNPIVFHHTPATVPAAAPQLGEHTSQILAEIGFTEQDQAYFSETGVTGKKQTKSRL